MIYDDMSTYTKFNFFSQDVADSDDRSSTAAVRINTTAASSPGSASLYLPPTPYAQVDKRKRRATKSNNELLMFAWQQLSSSSKQQDEFDTFGTNIAAKLRKLAKVNNMQRIIAEKLMSDVIFYGQLQTLTCNTSIHIPVQSTSESTATFTSTND